MFTDNESSTGLKKSRRRKKSRELASTSRMEKRLHFPKKRLAGPGETLPKKKLAQDARGKEKPIRGGPTPGGEIPE